MQFKRLHLFPRSHTQNPLVLSLPLHSVTLNYRNLLNQSPRVPRRSCPLHLGPLPMNLILLVAVGLVQRPLGLSRSLQSLCRLITCQNIKTFFLHDHRKTTSRPARPHLLIPQNLTHLSIQDGVKLPHPPSRLPTDKRQATEMIDRRVGHQGTLGKTQIQTKVTKKLQGLLVLRNLLGLLMWRMVFLRFSNDILLLLRDQSNLRKMLARHQYDLV